jgi:L,D-transpeptidase catalytic domain
MRGRALRAAVLSVLPGAGLALALAQHPESIDSTSQPQVTIDLADGDTGGTALGAMLDRVILDVAPMVADRLLSSRQLRLANERTAGRRLRDALTGEMLQNFALFLYVSKAAHGPLAQRMYAFEETGRNLRLLYDWPVSTGRESVESNPAGRRLPTFTPAGYYQLDPARFFPHHRSVQWGEPMPYAMFFNRIQNGSKTGLAIHAASGNEVARLGARASAGCVRLAPENARRLFELVRTKYEGPVPDFAFDSKTATTANDGTLMRDAHGRLKFGLGYKVLVVIEDQGGENTVAAML